MASEEVWMLSMESHGITGGLVRKSFSLNRFQKNFLVIKFYVRDNRLNSDMKSSTEKNKESV